MLTTGITKRVDIPHEPGEWLEIKMLTWRELQAAAQERSRTVLANAKEMGAEMLQGLQGREPAAEPDPVNSYDPVMLLQAGLSGWSYGAVLTPDAIDSLDQATAEWAAREIVAYSTPAAGEQLKNSSVPLTGLSTVRDKPRRNGA